MAIERSELSFRRSKSTKPKRLLKSLHTRAITADSQTQPDAGVSKNTFESNKFFESNFFNCMVPVII